MILDRVFDIFEILNQDFGDFGQDFADLNDFEKDFHDSRCVAANSSDGGF